VVHLNDATQESLARMKALGLGWLMQNAMYFQGEAFLRERGNEAMRLTPPIKTALNLGLDVGGGTDAHRVMSYNPFVSLQWMLDGKTVGGTATRDLDETPSREEALRLYTVGSTWFTHDESRRGSLRAGKLADLAVLAQDYMTMPVGEIGALTSLLDMVGRTHRVRGGALCGAGREAALNLTCRAQAVRSGTAAGRRRGSCAARRQCHTARGHRSARA
jgi:predicted amidohydrolase YtcJ